MNKLIDIENSSGYFVIKIIDGEEIKIDVKNMKENSPLLLSVANDRNQLMQVITLPGTGFSFMILEKKLNLVFKSIPSTKTNVSLRFNCNDNENNIFDSKIVSESKLNYLFIYYPKYKYVHGKISNELFSFAKKSINCYDRFHKDMFEKYVNIFNKYVIKYLISKKELFVICCVPSHNECDKINNTMSAVIKSVKNKYLEKFFIDGSNVLYRKYAIEKSSYNNCFRSLKKQYDSLIVKNSELIKEKTVLLIDDFYTTGSSINACKKILLENGAKKVILFTFGRTR